jgi:GTPase SAR1 family protein
MPDYRSVIEEYKEAADRAITLFKRANTEQVHALYVATKIELAELKRNIERLKSFYEINRRDTTELEELYKYIEDKEEYLADFI